MIKILANDGIDAAGKKMLEEAGLSVDTQKIPQEALKGRLKEYNAILIRSATKVRQDLIDAAPGLQLIGRAGVGMDNIDVEYARAKGVEVVNTPAASSLSVAELVFAHLFGMARFLHDSNRRMPSEGASKFNDLKKRYAEGIELRGKTLGIIGLGRIGTETARIAVGIGMQVLACGKVYKEADIGLELPGGQNATVVIKKVSKEEVVRNSDFISIHSPFSAGSDPILERSDFATMKDGVGLINCARGGVFREKDLLEALDSGKVAFAGLDVFENEPSPDPKLLAHPKVSLTPHIGASTAEAQQRIGLELARQVIEYFNKR